MKHKHALILLGITLPICIFLRTIQMCFTVDYKTGFIKQQYSAIGVAITVIICAAVASVGLLTATVDGAAQNKKSLQPVVAIASMLNGGMFVYEVVAGLTQQTDSAWYDTLLVICAFAAAVVFVAYGFRNVYEYQMPPIILTLPVVYYIVKLISVFVSTSALSLTTENVFLIFTSSIILWFMFELACFENEIGDTQKGPKKLFASGLAAIVMCFVTSVPKFIFAAVNSVELTSGDISAALLNVSTAIFILAYIVCNFSENSERKKPQSKHSA